eukprot:CAMPEP_0201737104 /NCGR_PEP_ID=MMETSP0593-20130828/41484_1 /ASSEMBLY_ACC=CAM_ASM_000672 /TAXON_ID=267983 /ORGANISM="Skeletonema japonicum, Strain CCMP2506" /LENGTH=81 /DNA_ID=CAMNT_0048230999 /DNA_START=28 /DNA_END=269 /DNA_ORIENTATION=-
MDVAAAIRAQTNQLEIQQQQRKKKKQQPTEFHNNSNKVKLKQQPSNINTSNYPPKSRSFHDERNQFNPYAQHQQQQYEAAP